MSSPSDAVVRWITAFQAVWTACGTVNTGAKAAHWNPFANAPTKTYLTSAGAQTTFKLALKQQFSENGLSDITIDQVVTSTETFGAYTTDMLGELWLSVVDLVAGYCPTGAPCFDSNGLVWTTPLPSAFPGGLTDSNFQMLMVAAKVSRLDDLIAPTAIATANTQVLSALATIQDLIVTLSTI